MVRQYACAVVQQVREREEEEINRKAKGEDEGDLMIVAILCEIKVVAAAELDYG